MDLPPITEGTFKTHARIIGPVIKCVAKESCSEAAAVERFLTLEGLDNLKQLL